MEELNTHEVVLRHYTNHWGRYSNRFEAEQDFRGTLSALSVLEFSPKTADQDWAYTTLGMSSFQMPYPKEWVDKRTSNRLEIFIYSNSRNEELKVLLMALAEYPFKKSTFFAQGHTVPGIQGIGGNLLMTDVLLLRPIGEPPEFEIIHTDALDHVQMLWIVPIYRSEREFIKKKGWESLLNLFYKNKAETSNFFREPVV
jgi:hypothetical protein